jgi:thiol-disulfide isomerase/thioredoxin
VVEGKLQTKLSLGNTKINHWNIALTKTKNNEYYNSLAIDHNQNGIYEDSEHILCTPSESRGKIWSSFNAILDIKAKDPWTKKETSIPYALSFWFVEDPQVENPEPVIRFSRKGWFEGEFVLDSVKTSIMLTEGLMDGIIDSNDYWALAPKGDRKLLFESNNCYSISHHAWINDKAYKILEVDASGLKVILEAYDPGMTLQEERIMEDPYYEDKIAKRSGLKVDFLHDYELALQKAIKENKNLFIDFETTWCGPCKQMDNLVYNTDAIVQATQDYIAVKVDGDKNPQLVDKYKVDSYPSLIIVDTEGNIVKRASGYHSVKMLKELLR